MNYLSIFYQTRRNAWEIRVPSPTNHEIIELPEISRSGHDGREMLIVIYSFATRTLCLPKGTSWAAFWVLPRKQTADADCVQKKS
jgi:hypothetical protein